MPVNETIPLDVQLGKYHNKNVVECKTIRKPLNLHRSATAARSTILVEIMADNVQYEPGDHVGILPANRKEIVDGILNRLSGVESFDEILQLQLLKENHTTNGIYTKQTESISMFLLWKLFDNWIYILSVHISFSVFFY